MASCLLILSCASAARAHGRPPYVEHIAFDPNVPDRVVVQFSYGLMFSDDAGASWGWVCGAAYNADSTWEDPDIVITEDGSTVIGTFSTASRAAPDLCTFEAPGGSIDDTAVLDLARDPRDADVVWAVTSRGGGEPDRLQRTDDGGRSWQTASEPFDALLETVALAPSDPMRVYLTGIVPATDLNDRRAILFRSDDGGETFTAIDLESLEDEQAPRVVGVDPTDADRLFVRMPRSELIDEPERLLYSDDGGGTFTLAHTMHQMRGFTMSGDGRTVWVGSASGDGVWVARDGTLDFTQISALRVRCLEARGDALWLCVDQANERFALGRSFDGGETVEPLLWLDRVEALPSCPTCATTAVICPFWIDDLRMDAEQFLGAEMAEPYDASIPPECVAPLPDAGVADGGSDAAMPDAGVAPPASGCGCRAATRGSPLAALLPPLALFLIWRRR